MDAAVLVVVVASLLGTAASGASPSSPAACRPASDPAFPGFAHHLRIDLDANRATLEMRVLDPGFPLCPTRVALPSYRARGTTRATSLPQELFAVVSGTLDADHPELSLGVPVPVCSPFQVDAIFVGSSDVGLLRRITALAEVGGPSTDYYERLIAIGFGGNYRSQGLASLEAGGRTWSETPDVSWWLDRTACLPGGRSQVPFDQVGPGWLLALQLLPEPGVTKWPSRPGLVVVRPDGTAYVPVVAPTAEPFSEILDWRPNGTEAIVRIGGTAAADGRRGQGGMVALVSLVDASVEPLGNGVVEAGFSRPSGTAVVARVEDGTSEWLELREGGSAVRLPTLRLGGDRPQRWLYGLEGRDLVVGDQFGAGPSTGRLTRYGNDGRSSVMLDSAWTYCEPVRWWDERTLLAACRRTASSANRLWLVPVDGGTSVALTPDGSNPIPGAEHGFTDAQWASTTVLLLQGEGLAGPRIFERRPDGTVRPFDVPGLPDDGRLVRSGEGRIVVSYAPDRGVLPLYSVRLDGDPMAIFPAPGPGDVLDIATNDWGTATAFGDRTAALDPLPPFENTEGLGHGGNKAQVCPASFYDRLPSALDADRNGAVETLQLSAVSGAGGFIDTRVELVERGSFPPRVLAGATVEVRAHGQEAYWYGDLNGDGWSEAVSCIPAWSGSGHPLTGLVVFGSGPSGWRVALSGVGNGAPVWIEARRDGLVVTLEAAYMAGTCRETTRDIYGWRDGLLVPTSHEMVSRRVVFPEDVEPVLGQCPWDRPQG